MTAGKLIYKTAFAFQKQFALFSTGIKAGIWFRNSLYQNYFKFGKSDIDVTIVLESDTNLADCAKKISKNLQHCPLIKEINVYYPFSLRYAPRLINAYELKKDPKLNKLLSSSECSDADQFVYLLRMYFANLTQKSFNSRDCKKWIYHFSLVGKPQLSASLKTGMSRADLLNIITGDQNQNVRETLLYAAEGFLKQAELYDLYINGRNKDILAMILPQHFCFAELSGCMEDPWMEKIFLSQMTWEIWAMMTQPALFSQNGPGQVHLENILKALSRNKSKRGEELLKIAEEFGRFSSNHP